MLVCLEQYMSGTEKERMSRGIRVYVVKKRKISF